MIYLSTPYSHPDPEVRRLRYEKTLEVTRKFWLANIHVFSPIVHSHFIQLSLPEVLPQGLDLHGFFMRFDYDMLRRCDDLYVLMMDGWEESKGIAYEVAFALGARIPITYLDEHKLALMHVECTLDILEIRNTEPATLNKV